MCPFLSSRFNRQMTAIASGLISAHIGLVLAALMVVLAQAAGVNSPGALRSVFAVGLSTMLVGAYCVGRLTWRWLRRWAEENGLEKAMPKNSGQLEA